jgi:hypothetical protein
MREYGRAYDRFGLISGFAVMSALRPLLRRKQKSIRGLASRKRATRRHRNLLRFDVGRLNDRPPLLDFGIVKCAQRLRRLLVKRRNFLP